MSDESKACPKCHCEYGYQDGSLWVCPECFHEWSFEAETNEIELGKFVDVNGMALSDGDSVITIKDLKAGKETIKSGTKVKNIKLLETQVNGHDISCKIPGFGSMYLKCSVVKKVKS